MISPLFLQSPHTTHDTTSLLVDHLSTYKLVVNRLVSLEQSKLQIHSKLLWIIQRFFALQKWLKTAKKVFVLYDIKLNVCDDGKWQHMTLAGSAVQSLNQTGHVLVNISRLKIWWGLRDQVIKICRTFHTQNFILFFT